MSASGYVAWAVTAGEIPTTAYWNILGFNDASFNTGNGFNDSILQNRHIGSTFISGGVQTYTPSVGAISGGSYSGQTGFYINIGGWKLSWGNITIGSTANGTHVTGITLPPSNFFNTISIWLPSIPSVGNYAYQTVSGDSILSSGGYPATFGVYINNTGNTGGCSVQWILIGT